MLRNTLHATAAALLWVVFIYYWCIVLRRPMSADTKTALVTLSVITAVSMGCIAVWVFHNVRVYRALDRRKARRGAVLDTHRDVLGRRVIIGDPAVLKRATYIEVDVERGFVAGDPAEWKVFRSRTRSGVRF
jgi:hypothetical protein